MSIKTPPESLIQSGTGKPQLRNIKKLTSCSFLTLLRKIPTTACPGRCLVTLSITVFAVDVWVKSRIL